MFRQHRLWSSLLRTFSRAASLLAIVLIFGIFAACGASDRVRIVPQVGPVWPVRLAFSPEDPYLLVIVEMAGAVSLWDVHDWARPLRKLALYTQATDARILPGGSIATGEQDGSLRLWSFDGSLHKSWHAHQGKVLAIDASPAGLVSAGEDGTVALWGLDGSAKVNPFRAHAKEAVAVAVSPRGDTFASVGADGKVCLWNLKGEKIWEKESGGVSISFSRKGDLLAVIGSGKLKNVVYLRGVNQALKDSEIRNEKEVRSVTFSPRFDFLATADVDGRVRLWDLNGVSLGEAGNYIQEGAEYLPRDPWVALAFSSAMDFLAVGKMGEVSFWLLDGRPLDGSIRSSNMKIDANPGKNMIAAATNNYETNDKDKVNVWDFTGRLRSQQVMDNEVVGDLAIAPDGQQLATSGAFKGVHLWRPTGESVSVESPGKMGLSSSRVAFSPAGGSFALANESHVVFWRPDGSIQASTALKAEDLTAIAFSAEGDRLGLGSGSFRKQKGRVEIRGIDGSLWGEDTEWPVLAVSFSPQRHLFVAGEGDGKVYLWQGISGTSSWRSLGKPLSHGDAVTATAFSPDGSLLATGGSDGVLRLWDMPAGSPHGERLALGYEISRLGFAGRFVWVATEGGQIFFASSEPRLSAHIALGEKSFVATTVSGWYAGDGELAASALLFRGNSLEPLSMDVRAAHYSADEVALATGSAERWLKARAAVLAVTEQIWRTVLAVTEQIRRTYSLLPWYAKAASWPAVLYILAVFLVAWLWLFRPHVLAAWAMPSRTAAVPPGWEIWTKTLALISWLGQTPRALDRWLTIHSGELAATAFHSIEAVQKRGRYVDLGNEDNLASWHDDLRSGRAARYWITGPGGCGKSTLAFHMAQVIENGKSHPRLPVLLDQDWDGPVEGYVANLLRVGNRQPSVAMVEMLGFSGRILLIVDGLSERSMKEAVGQIAKLDQQATFRSMIVSSRDPAPKGSHFREVAMAPLDRKRLRTFVEAYTPEDQADGVETALARLTHGQPIRPLFAKLAIERIVAGKTVPASYPTLVVDYVRELKPQGDGALRDEDFFRAARLVAFACVDEELAPRQVSSEFLRGQLKAQPLSFFSGGEESKEKRPEEVIDQLVQCGLLERVTSLAIIYIRFSFDLIAEYLAAMHIVTQGTDKVAEMKGRLGNREGGLIEALQRIEDAAMRGFQ